MNGNISGIKSRRITVYETSDGKQHATQFEARRYDIYMKLATIVALYEGVADSSEVVRALLRDADTVASLLRRYTTITNTEIRKTDARSRSDTSHTTEE